MKTNINSYYRLARWDKPIGTWLLLIPCWWGLALAGSHDISLYLIFAIGAISMRSAGCVINDIADRKLDAKVSRTKNRPLASGEIKVPEALVFLGVLLAVGLFVLIYLPLPAIKIAVATLPLVVIYPFSKRFSRFPQLFLGITFNVGVLVGYAAVKEETNLPAAFCYLAAVFWTLGYDTIYALQDAKHDKKIGIKSTAITFGKSTPVYIFYFYSAFLFLFMLANFLTFGFSFLSFLIMLCGGAHLTWQLLKLDMTKPKTCGEIFRSNMYTGLIFLAALLVH